MIASIAHRHRRRRALRGAASGCSRGPRLRVRLPAAAALLGACVGLGLGPGGDARPAAASTGELGERLQRAESEARALRSELASGREEMFSAEQRAGAAAGQVREAAASLESGRHRRVALAGAIRASDRRLRAESDRLARAEALLAERLVAIYKAGPADSFSVTVEADGYEDLITRTSYMRQIRDADSRLAGRVREVRERVVTVTRRLRSSHAQARANEEAMAAAHADRLAASAAAESRAAELRGVSSERDEALTTLTSRIGGWERDLARAERRRAEEANRGDAGAEEPGRDGSGPPGEENPSTDPSPEGESVDGWLGGPYAIPTEIVMCESGGNYRALNPASGAGGAYQIIPSTWEAYGGSGLPHEAPKAEQDRIAAMIWADSGSGAWVCAG